MFAAVAPGRGGCRGAVLGTSASVSELSDGDEPVSPAGRSWIYLGRAAGVRYLGPPLKCSGTVAPLRAAELTRRKIALVPGTDQSRGSTSHMTVSRPIDRASDQSGGTAGALATGRG